MSEKLEKIMGHYYSKGVMVGILLQNFFMFWWLFISLESMKNSLILILMTIVFFSIIGLIFFIKHRSKNIEELTQDRGKD